MDHDRPSDELNLAVPSLARIYDFTLGGSANFEVDRVAARQWMEQFPGQTDYAFNNRGFLRRAVAELVSMGFTQFLDLGSGIPTVGNVHEIAHRIDPRVRVAYVDIDPVAVHHARALLASGAATSTVTSTDADMRDPAAVLAAPGVADLLDFTRPVAVLMLGILDIIDTRETAPPDEIIAGYRDACPAGSALAVSNGAQLSISDETRAAVLRLLAETSTPVGTYRDETEVAALFAGYTIIEPGVVPTAAWRPDRPVTREQALESNALAAVGVKT